MKTTIEIRDPLLREAREVARREKTTLRALVEEGLTGVLKDRRKVRTRRYRWKLVVHDGGGLMPGIDLNDWRKIREMANERGLS